MNAIANLEQVRGLVHERNTLAARVAELEAILKEIHDEVEIYINNPSAWNNYDESVSDMLRYKIYNKSHVNTA